MDTLTLNDVTEQPDTLPPQPTDHPLYQEVEGCINQGDWQAASQPLQELLTLYPDDNYLKEIAASIQARSALLESDEEIKPTQGSILARSMRFVLPAIIVMAILVWTAIALLVLQLWILPRAQAQRQTAQIDQLQQSAQAALVSGDYDRAIVAYKEILAIVPNDLGAQNGLVKANQLRGTASLYSEAIAAMEAHHWEDALSILEQIQAANPGYRDVAERIIFVQHEQDLSARFSDAEAAFERGYYDLAVQQYEALQATDFSYQRETVQDHLFISYLQLGQSQEAAAGDDPEQLQTALVNYEKALAIRPEDAQVKGESQLIKLYISGLEELEEENWSQATADLTTVYEARPDFAGGAVSIHLYRAKVAWGDELLADGQFDGALVVYKEAYLIKGVDTTGLNQKIAMTEQMLVTPTPSPEPTAAATASSVSVVARPAPTPTPQPLPYSLVGMSIKSNCDGHGYIHGVVRSGYDLPIAGTTVQAYNTTTGLGPLVSLPTNDDGIYQIILEKDQIDGLWVVQVLENGQPASQTWGQHLGGGCTNGAQELKVDWKRVLDTN